MSKRALILLAALLVVVFAVGGGMYAYDQTGRDSIPKGVKIAGIDVGGLNAAQARAKLDRTYLARLRAPVRVDHGASSFVLSPQESHVSANVDAMVDDALAEVHHGNIFSRTLRRLTGGSLHADLRPETTYSERAAVRLLDKVRASVDRDPQDASVTFAGIHPTIRRARDGLSVQAHQLHQQIDRAIVDPYASHRLVAHTQHVAPKVGTSEVARQYNTALVVDRAHFELHLYKNLKLIKTYHVAIGAVGLETPAGLYHIQNKQVDPSWTEPNSSWVAPADRGKVVPPGPADPLKARWLGIFGGAGIHGIDPSEYGSIGHAASHGCVRMTIPDVIDLYPRVPVGAPIYIA